MSMHLLASGSSVARLCCSKVQCMNSGAHLAKRLRVARDAHHACLVQVQLRLVHCSHLQTSGTRPQHKHDLHELAG